MAAEFAGVRFNHLSLENAPTLPHNGPYTILVPLAAALSDPGSDPVVAGHLAQGKTLLFVAPAHIALNTVTVAALR